MKKLTGFLLISIVIMCVLMLFAGPVAASIIADSYFNDSANSAALRANGSGQDWYESRNDDPTILYLDTSTIDGNSTKKAGFREDTNHNAYLSQEFSSAQSSTFSLKWDIYVDTILNDFNRDRAAIQMIGDDPGGSNTPNSTGPERFVYMAFYDYNGATEGSDMSLIAMEPGDTYNTSSTWRTIASGLSLDEWITIQVKCYLDTDTYDVWVNDTLEATGVVAYTTKDSLTHISFAQWDDGAGTFYVDNVVPIPGSLLLLGSGIIGLVVLRRRPKKQM
jgi:type II secretory pathway pseudopilin PulG